MVSRFIGSGREQEGGFLATHKQDFNAHVTGGDWRHGATAIDMDPVITGIGGATVQTTLENLAATFQSAGSGFISIGNLGGDGYLGTDGYAAGSYNVGSISTPTLADAFNAAFNDSRLQNGGIILLLAGTYKINNTIEVPPGIHIMGETAGSIIIGQTNELSIFKILAGTDRPNIGGNSGLGDTALEVGSPIDETRLTNLIIADNLDGYVQSVGQPIASMQTVPMIEAEISSRLLCEGIKFIGRLNNGVVSGRGKTQAAIGGYTSGGGTSSHLTVRKCYFDGLRIGIDFIPSNGDIDFLTIESCRARVFGTEDGAALGKELNCFANMSLCHLQAHNNYIVSTSSGFVTSGFNVEATGGGSSDVFIVLSGNTGGGFTTSSNLFSNSTSSPIHAVKTGNNWNSVLKADWYVTVCSGASLDETGDFIGTNSIDLLLQSSATHNYPTTVILVGEGPFEITENGNDRFSYVGKREGNRWPIVDLNLGAGAPTDEAGNRYFATGSLLQNVFFRCRTAVTSSYHTVRPDDPVTSTTGLKVVDCKFQNVCLSPSESYNGGVIINCLFEQDNNYDDNISIMVAAPGEKNILLLDRCVFIGAGYAGLVGEDATIGYDSGADTGGILTINDCLFDKTGFSIDNSSPLTIESYLVINAPLTKVTIDNTKVFADNTTAITTSAINSSLDTTFLRWVYLECDELSMNNSMVHSPSQTIDVSATDYPLPGLEINVAGESSDFRAKIWGCEFFYGVFRITGTIGSRSYASIDGCNFIAGGDNIGHQTAVDIALDQSGTEESLQLRFTNNQIRFAAQSVWNKFVYHTTSALYDAIGLVQIYAEGHDCHISNNQLYGVIGLAATTIPGSKNHISALVVDNTNNGNAANTAALIVNNNSVQITNGYVNASSTTSASACHLRGLDVVVEGNRLQVDQLAAINGSGTHCLFVENRQTSANEDPAPAVITGNIFSTKEFDGGSSFGPSNGYVYISSSTEGEGTVSNNSFAEATTAGGASDASAVYDNDTSEIWLSFLNKNETVALVVSGALGVHAVDGTVKGNDSGATSYIQVEQSIGGTDEVVQWLYVDNPDTVTFEWFIDVAGLVPLGALITNVAVQHEVTTSAPDTTNSLTIRIFNISSGTGNSTSVTPGAQTTTNLSGTLRNTSNTGTWIGLDWSCDDSSGPIILEIQDLTISYRL